METIYQKAFRAKGIVKTQAAAWGQEYEATIRRSGGIDEWKQHLGLLDVNDTPFVVSFYILLSKVSHHHLM